MWKRKKAIAGTKCTARALEREQFEPTLWSAGHDKDGRSAKWDAGNKIRNPHLHTGRLFIG
jgi:hypothetical protein